MSDQPTLPDALLDEIEHLRAALRLSEERQQQLVAARLQAEAALRRDIQHQEALARCSQVLLQPTHAQAERMQLLTEAIHHLLEGAQVSRAYVFEHFLDPADGLCLRIIAEACAPGIPASITFPVCQKYPWARLPEVIQHNIETGTPLVGTLEVLYATTPELLQALKEQQIVSLQIFPIRLHGQLWGHLGFDDCVHARLWERHELLLLRTAAEMLGSVLQRWQAEDAIHTLTSQQRTMLDTIPDLVWLTDAAARCIAVNAAYSHFYGRAATTFVGTTDAEAFQSVEGQHFYQETLTIIATGQPRSYEQPRTNHAGQVRWFELTKSPVFSPQGNVLGAVGIARDITARKQGEEARLQLERKMQETQRLESLGVLAGGIAHDFNNLLAGIIGHAELAHLELEPSSVAHPSIDMVITGARRAADLTNQIMAYAGKGRFVIQPVLLNDLLREMADLVRVSVSQYATFQLCLADALPPIDADAAQVRQVVLNLLTNAAEAIGALSGVITLATASVSLTRAQLDQLLLGTQLPPGMYVELTITDTGSGLDATMLARIFDPFFTTKFTGRGLGLAAVQGIVRGHRGALSVASTPGTGTTFSIWFPASRTQPGELPRAAPAVITASGALLVIDDEPLTRAVTAQLLERMGFTVQTAANGADGLALVASQPDLQLVLVDLVMPHMSGDAVARALHEARPGLPVVLMSGYNAEELAQQHGTLALAGFLQKPFTYTALHRIVSAALATKPQSYAPS